MCLQLHASLFRALKKPIVLTLPHRSAKTARFLSGYVEDFDEPSATLRSLFSTLLCR